jgi:hypothetical protein
MNFFSVQTEWNIVTVVAVLLGIMVEGLFIKGISDFFRWRSYGSAWMGIGLNIVVALMAMAVIIEIHLHP